MYINIDWYVGEIPHPEYPHNENIEIVTAANNCIYFGSECRELNSSVNYTKHIVIKTKCIENFVQF